MTTLERRPTIREIREPKKESAKQIPKSGEIPGEEWNSSYCVERGSG